MGQSQHYSLNATTLTRQRMDTGAQYLAAVTRLILCFLVGFVLRPLFWSSILSTVGQFISKMAEYKTLKRLTDSRLPSSCDTTVALLTSGETVSVETSGAVSPKMLQQLFELLSSLRLKKSAYNGLSSCLTSGNSAFGLEIGL